MTIETARGKVQARALVTRRMRPFTINGKDGARDRPSLALGLAGSRRRGRGEQSDSVLVADPNVTIHEGKVFTCNVRAGKRGGAA